jgi:transcriptional regulator with XRE-family HTH domain
MRDLDPVARARRTLGNTMRRLRRAKSWTQMYAAVRAGIHWRHWQKIEGAEVNITIITLVKIAAALETTIAELFTERRVAS